MASGRTAAIAGWADAAHLTRPDQRESSTMLEHQELAEHHHGDRPGVRYRQRLLDSAREPHDLDTPLPDGNERKERLRAAIDLIPGNAIPQVGEVLAAAARGTGPIDGRPGYLTVLYNESLIPDRNASGYTDQPAAPDPRKVMIALGVRASNDVAAITLHEYTHLATIVAFGHAEPHTDANSERIYEETVKGVDPQRREMGWETWIGQVSGGNQNLAGSLRGVIEDWRDYSPGDIGREMVPHFMELVFRLNEYHVPVHFAAGGDDVFQTLMTFVVRQFLPRLAAVPLG
jgi:hypothetical protein